MRAALELIEGYFLVGEDQDRKSSRSHNERVKLLTEALQEDWNVDAGGAILTYILGSQVRTREEYLNELERFDACAKISSKQPPTYDLRRLRNHLRKPKERSWPSGLTDDILHKLANSVTKLLEFRKTAQHPSARYVEEIQNALCPPKRRNPDGEWVTTTEPKDRFHRLLIPLLERLLDQVRNRLHAFVGQLFFE